jgi:hypothetical protein
VLGEQAATVAQVRPFDLHGVSYYDITLTLSDGSSLDGRLGFESVPDGLRPGEAVLATVAAGMMVSIRRP